MNFLKVLLLSTITTTAFAVNSSLQSTDAKQLLGAKAPRNYIKNSGMERNDTNVTDASSIASRTTTTPLEGVASLLIDASAGSQLVVVTADDFQTGMLGKSCEATFQYNGDASLYTAYVTLAGTTVSSTVTLVNTGSSSQNVSLPFPCGTSTTDDPAIVIASTGNGASVEFDSFYLGEAVSTGLVAQAEVVVRATRITTNQTISSAGDVKLEFNGETFDAYAEYDPTTNFRYTPKRAGRYRINASAFITLNGDVATNLLVVKNGTTTTCLSTGVNYSGSEGRPQINCVVDLVVGDYIEIFKGTGTDAATALVAGATFSFFEVTRFPTATEIVLRGDTSDLSGNTLSAATASCQWSSTSATLAAFSADADCPTPSVSGNAAAPATKIPAFVAPVLRPGRYMVQALSAFDTSTSTSGSPTCVFDIFDGTNSGGKQLLEHDVNVGRASTAVIGGVFNYTSQQTNIQFQVRAQRLAGNGTCLLSANAADLSFVLIPINNSLPQPLIPGSVFSNSLGVERVERVKLNCSSSSAIQEQSGSWVSSVGNISGNRCAVTIASGIFSSNPVCTGGVNTTETGTLRSTHINITSATAFTVGCVSQAGASTNACTNNEFYITCQGPR